MLTFDETQEVLTEIADSLPLEIFGGLNGGILLLPDTKLHPESRGNDLYITGEYHYDPKGFGRYITVYYGSFCRVCAHMDREAQISFLRDVLHHELVHHLEGLAGDKSLEARDAADIDAYKRKRRKKP